MLHLGTDSHVLSITLIAFFVPAFISLHIKFLRFFNVFFGMLKYWARPPPPGFGLATPMNDYRKAYVANKSLEQLYFSLTKQYSRTLSDRV